MGVPTVVASNVSSDTNSTTITTSLSVTSASDRVLLAVVSFFDPNNVTGTVSSVVFDPSGGDEDSFTVTDAIATYDATHRYRTEIWSLVLDDGVSSGAYNITATLSVSASGLQNAAWELNGANTSSPVDAFGAATSSWGDTLSVDVATNNTNSLVAAGGSHFGDGNFTEGADDTEETDSALNACSQWTGYTPAVTTDTYTVSAVAAAGNNIWTMAGIEVKEAAGVTALDVNISPSANYVQVTGP